MEKKILLLLKHSCRNLASQAMVVGSTTWGGLFRIWWKNAQAYISSGKYK